MKLAGGRFGRRCAADSGGSPTPSGTVLAMFEYRALQKSHHNSLSLLSSHGTSLLTITDSIPSSRVSCSVLSRMIPRKRPAA